MYRTSHVPNFSNITQFSIFRRLRRANVSFQTGIFYWKNCAFGLYPLSGVSKNKQNWGIKNIDKISQYTRPQNSDKGQLLTTEQLTWAHTHMNPW